MPYRAGCTCSRHPNDGRPMRAYQVRSSGRVDGHDDREQRAAGQRQRRPAVGLPLLHHRLHPAPTNPNTNKSNVMVTPRTHIPHKNKLPQQECGPVHREDF
jgi:hypothetical protein